MEFGHLVILFFAFLSLLMGSFFIIRKSEIGYANRLLAFFLFASAWLLVSSVLFWTNLLYNPKFIHFDFTYYVPFSLYAPLFFFYLRAICESEEINLKKDFYHFLPFVYIIISIAPYYVLSAEKKVKINEESSPVQYLRFLSTNTEVIIVFLMLIYSSILLFRYWNKNKTDFDLLIWSRAILIAFIGSVLSFSVYYFLYYLGILSAGQDFAIVLILSLFILTISYFAFNYSEVFNGKRISSVIPFVKYQKTGLSKKVSRDLKEKLESIMREKKPYLDVELRLNSVAELLGVGRHQASQVINEHFNSSFFEYINGYRIQESKRILQDQKKKINLSEVAYLSGFNNTVSFNIAFKKITGVKPSEYRKMVIDGEDKFC